MSDVVYAFTATLAPGSSATSPQTIALTLPNYPVDRINYRVPPGPSGFMGWVLFVGGGQILPAAPSPWLVMDDETDDWYLDDQPTSGAWDLVGYNYDVFPHSVYLRFFCTANATPAIQPTPTTPVFVETPSSTLTDEAILETTGVPLS